MVAGNGHGRYSAASRSVATQRTGVHRILSGTGNVCYELFSCTWTNWLCFQFPFSQACFDLELIEPYQCPNRLDHIGAGMAVFYVGHKCMEPFPIDVALAENRTNGDPNIIFSTEFDPIYYVGRLCRFGTNRRERSKC